MPRGLTPWFQAVRQTRTDEIRANDGIARGHHNQLKRAGITFDPESV